MSSIIASRQRRIAVAAAAVLSIALGGCASSASGGGSSSAAGSAAGSSGAGGGGTIIFGVLAPFTGPNAQSATDLMKGVKLAVDEVNAAGGVLGKQIKVVTGDTVSDPTDAVSAASKLVNSDGAQVIIGPRTITGPAVLPITQRAQVPELIVGGSTVLDTNTDTFFFRTTPSDSQQGVAMAAYAIQKGYKRAALAFELQPAAQTLKDPITKAFTKHGGTIVATVDITPSQSSYRSEIQKLYASKPDVIFTQISAQSASVFFPEVQQLEGLSKVPYIGSNTFDSSDFFQAVGATIAQGPIYATQSVSTGGAASQHYLAEYQKAYGTNQIANLSNNMYDAVILAALAMQQSGVTTGPKLAAAITSVASPPGTTVSTFADGRAAIKAGQKVNYDGAGGNVDFNKYHNVFGPFAVLHFNASGKTDTVTTLPASVLANW